MHRAAFVIVEKFDWVFNRQDVAGLFCVNAVKHRGQRGGLPRSAWPRYQNNAVVQSSDLRDMWWEPKPRKVGDRSRNRAHDHGAAATLDEDIHAKPRQTG